MVKHVDLPVQDWIAQAINGGLPQDYSDMLGMLITLIRDGYDVEVSDGVPRALDRSSTPLTGAREAGSLA